MNPFRKILCILQMCPHKPASDDTGCWGECIHCGKRAGFVDRATLRRLCDRDWEEYQRRNPPLTDEAKLRRSKALDELGALDGELL